MALTDFSRQVYFATVHIASWDAAVKDTVDDEKPKTGTGFIVRIAGDSKPNLAFVLVTCKHVLCGVDGLVSFKLHTLDTDRTLPLLVEGIDVGPRSFAEHYFQHDDPAADVVALDITDVMENPKTYAHWLNSQTITDANLDHLGPNRDAIFIGYPEGIYDKKNNLPVLRAARVASIPEIDFDGKPQYLIDAQVFSGSSGSPIFAEDPHGQACFVGMIGESFERWKNATMGERRLDMGFAHFVGLGVVYKPRVIASVLAKVKAAALAREEARGAQNAK